MLFFGRIAPATLDKLVAWEERQLTEFKKMNPVGINKTQEDELLLIPFFATPTMAVTFPHMRELEELEYFDELPEGDRKAVLALYRECVERQLAFCGGEQTFLSKNPTFVGKLRSILEEFPDARIIYPKRDPHDSIPSLLTMMQHVWEGMGFDEDEVRPDEYSQWLDAESQSHETVSTRDAGSLAEFGIDRQKLAAELGIDSARPR